MPRTTKYFVSSLSTEDYKPFPGAKFEVQLQSPAGGPGVSGYFGDDEVQLVVGGESIPLAVLQAARRQPFGQGDYVNEKGETVPAF